MFGICEAIFNKCENAINLIHVHLFEKYCFSELLIKFILKNCILLIGSNIEAINNTIIFHSFVIYKNTIYIIVN